MIVHNTLGTDIWHARGLECRLLDLSACGFQGFDSEFRLAYHMRALAFVDTENPASMRGDPLSLDAECWCIAFSTGLDSSREEEGVGEYRCMQWKERSGKVIVVP